MKIVFDTNMILSALLTQGLSARVLDICIDLHELYISPWIINEVLRKLEKKFKVPSDELLRVEEFLKSGFIPVESAGRLPDICRDKDDNNILLLAENQNTDLIITGDKDLLVLKKYLNTEIITPRFFLEKHYKP